MEIEPENDNDAPEAEEIDAPGSPEPQGDDDDADAYREFLADKRTMRYDDDVPANKRKLYDYLLKYRPPLPKSQAALYLAFDELRKADKLELIPLAPEQTDELTAGEAKQAEEAERAEPEPTQNE